MIEVGILKNFDSGTYKAGVQLAGSLTTYFDDISVAKNIPSSALVIGNYVILAIPGGNPRDACVIATWLQGTAGGAEVHGNEYHDPDFEEEGVAASLVDTHRTTQTHTQPQPPAEHGNEKHNPDFATETALSSHEALTNPHSATPSAIPNRLVLRDASGRAKVAAPSASDDIARKQEVDAKPSTFLQLTDTPSSYSSQARKLMAVNAGESALEFVSGKAFYEIAPPVEVYWMIDVGSSPRTATISSVSGYVITLTANDAHRFFANNMEGKSYLKIANTSKSPTEYAWVKEYTGADQLKVKDAADISGWSNGDTISTQKNDTDTDQVQVDLSPTIPEGATGVFVYFTARDSGTITVSPAIGSRVSPGGISGTYQAVYCQVSDIVNSAGFFVPVDSNRCIVFKDDATGLDMIDIGCKVAGYVK